MHITKTLSPAYAADGVFLHDREKKTDEMNLSEMRKMLQSVMNYIIMT